MKEIGVGVVGIGYMGKTHTMAYQTIPFYYDNLPFKIKLVGVCSRSKESAEKAKQYYGFELATTDYDELLRRDDIHIINICTPNAYHKDMAIKAVKAGKHVYCDKPMTVSHEEAVEVLEVLKDHPGVITQMVFQNRFFPITMRAKQIIEEGRIGKPLSFRAVYLHSGSVDAGKPVGWRMDISEGGGGVLFDLGSHVIDLIYYLIGEYSSLSAKTHVLYPQRPDKHGNMVNITADDMAMMMAVMKNGALGTIEASKIATGMNDELKVEMHGDKGAIKFNIMEPNWLEFYDNTVSDQPLGGMKGFTKIECVQRFEKPGGSFLAPKAAIGWGRSHIHSLFNFVSCVDKGVQASPSLKDGAYIQYVMEKAYQSAAEKRWIEL